jgi:hypothetical protein
MALDTTIGGASSDSYDTLEAYVAYVVANIDAAFAGGDEVSLRRAAQYLDRRFQFFGYKQYETQARAWPRITGQIVDGWPIDADTIPQAIKHSQFEAAYAFEVEGLDPLAALTTGTVKRTRSKAGPVETETEYEMGRSTPRLVAIEGLLRGYVMGGVGGAQVRLVRG